MFDFRRGFAVRWLDYLKKVATVPSRSDASCLMCNRALSSMSSGALLCRDCAGRIPWISEVICEICGRGELCEDCERRRVRYFARNRSAVRYDEVMKGLLAMYKYRGDERLERLMIEMMSPVCARLAAEHLQGKRPIVTYIPLSDRRLAERGFNQAERLASGVAHQCKLGVVPLLVRAVHTDRQSFKSRMERLASLRGVFEADPAGVAAMREMGPGDLAPAIILVDDVYTTGSTLNEAAKTIGEQLPGVPIYGLTWAR